MVILEAIVRVGVGAWLRVEGGGVGGSGSGTGAESSKS